MSLDITLSCDWLKRVCSPLEYIRGSENYVRGQSPEFCPQNQAIIISLKLIDFNL